jgi:recombination associated protein RdgC
MFFRNLTLYRFADAIDPVALEDALKSLPLREPNAVEIETTGFVPVAGHGNDEVVRWCGNAALFCLGYRTRLLPSVVIAEHVAKRVAEISAKLGRRVGAKERRQLKEEIVSQLLPRAFVRPSRTYAYIDVKEGWLVIDTSSRARAEDVINELRTGLGRFPCTPVAPGESPRVAMTDWLIHLKLPADLAFGDEVDLRDPAEGGRRWNGRSTDLETDEVREHLSSGMQVWRIGLTYADRIAFVLGEDLVVRKLRFLDSALDELDDEHESAIAELDARFALMRLELERLFAIFCKAFDIDRNPKLAMDGGEAQPTEKLARRLTDLNDEEFDAAMNAAYERHPDHLAAINRLRAARAAGTALDLAADGGVLRAAAKFAELLQRHGASVTIQTMTDGKVTKEVHIDKARAQRIKRNAARRIKEITDA